jgi:hypothetical protein
LEKWFNDENAGAINVAIQIFRTSIKNHEILKIKAMEILDAKDNRKIPLSALIEHIYIY